MPAFSINGAAMGEWRWGKGQGLQTFVYLTVGTGIGGSGEKKTLRLVAQYADACNLFARMGIDVVRTKLETLKGHCEKIGRDYAEIEKTTLSTVHLAHDKPSARDVIEECRARAGIGIQRSIFSMYNIHEITSLETFGREIIPAVAEL